MTDDLPTQVHQAAYILPDKICEEIGKIITRFSYIENNLSQSIYKILGIGPKEGRLAIRDQDVTTKLEIITDLLALKNISVETDLKKLRKDIEKILARRNQIAHAVWIEGQDNYYLRETKGRWQPVKGMQGTVKRTIYPEAQKFNLDDAKLLTADVDAIATRVITLMQEMNP